MIKRSYVNLLPKSSSNFLQYFLTDDVLVTKQVGKEHGCVGLGEFEAYISHVCLSVTKAMNHIYSSQTNSFCEEKKQTNESSVKYIGTDSTKTVLKVFPLPEEWPKPLLLKFSDRKLAATVSPNQ